jgi:antitoxin (DNA-binding transcriptional repressor) of toxin-antitoxin stability system
VTITDRGNPVARLVPPQAEPRRPFAGATEFRRRMPVLPVPLSTTIVDDRVDERAERV